MWCDAPESTSHGCLELDVLAEFAESEAIIELSMPHYEESAVVCVFRVRGVICELSACGSRFALLLSTLFFVMAELSAISASVAC